MGEQRPSQESVLFKIVIFTSDEQCFPPYADISHLSRFTDEQEVILSVGSVCSIVSVQDEGTHWCVQMSLCSWNHPRLTQMKTAVLNPLMQFESRSETTSINILGYLLMTMGERQKALMLLEMGPTTARGLYSDQTRRGFDTLNGLFRFSNEMTRSSVTPDRSTMVDEAQRILAYYRDTSNSMREISNFLSQFPEHASSITPLVHTVENLCGFVSSVFSGMGDQDKIPHLLSQLESTEAALQHSFLPDHPLMTNFASLKGLFQAGQGNHAGAIVELEQSLRNFDSILGTQYPVRWGILVSIGDAAEKLHDEEKALDSYMQSLEVYDPDPVLDIKNRLYSTERLARLFMKREEFDVAIQFYSNIVDMPQISPRSQEIECALGEIIKIHKKRGDWEAAISSMQQLIGIKRANGADVEYYESQIAMMEQQLHQRE
ncbi:unnamed protein product [Didymodactylos carnosus]|uniref:Uncharacterized protein n=1 Tax=Didymodactylos carnosus TaxID=1234261 RepID=A0A815ZAZ6_9BILA|nr:unnamed protein product [Didymodactylos carnosus]CAF1580436.1 unnamed protein product [Didymodactylos carnosus]CAF3785985.1 unnamed protein product [Didymodactylos carnosus]CAF4447628.1 unnamed protein product [Didymodactylos carnosus]